MIEPWWAIGIAVPALVVRGVVAARINHKQKALEAQAKDNLDDRAAPGSSFVCERVCTSSRLMKRMGNLAKDPTPNNCVTVCGTSAEDACIEACQRNVCAQVHHVPDWNDQCLKRCTTECMKGRAV